MSRKLVAYVHVAGSVYGPGDKVPVDVAAQIVNPKAWEGGDAPDAGESESGDYESLTKAQLAEEIEKRNEGRDDETKVSPSGTNKADLVAALVVDDAVGDN